MSSYQSISMFMKVLLRIDAVKIAWAFRRLYCPVKKDALVLEVGSGGSPYHRANVLLDAYEDTRERHWAPLVTDRPCVLGYGERLPFKDKVFDFVIASHVLEHSSDPESFLSELERVAKAGYIETPDAFMERINPYWDHRLEVSHKDGKLVIKKKSEWCIDQEISQLYEARAKNIIAKKTIPEHPFEFHTRFYWKSRIDYLIVNPDTDATWDVPNLSHSTTVADTPKARFGRIFLWLIRKFFSQNRRNSSIDIFKILQCPECASDINKIDSKTMGCDNCGSKFGIKKNIPNFSEYKQCI
jgi:SAM-dependent methyltransferase